MVHNFKYIIGFAAQHIHNAQDDPAGIGYKIRYGQHAFFEQNFFRLVRHRDIGNTGNDFSLNGTDVITGNTNAAWRRV